MDEGAGGETGGHDHGNPGPLPDYAYLSRWFRGPPGATTGFDSFLAWLGAALLTGTVIAVAVRRIWF